MKLYRTDAFQKSGFKNMKSSCCTFFLLIVSVYLFAQEKALSPEQYRQDFNYFWKSIRDEYCYFDKKQTDWEKVNELYGAMADTVKSRDAFVSVLEKAFNELYDHHCGLHTNTDLSSRLVPTATDLWAEFLNGQPVITEVRAKSGAEACGIKAGMWIVSINDIAVESAIESILPACLKHPDTEARNFALRLLLAGNHIRPRKFILGNQGKTAEFFPDQSGMLLEHITYTSKVETKMFGNTGYIRINNCLYDNDLIPLFDSVMQTMRNTTGLILDLRETPSGGNTSVARAILGWFMEKEHFYQKHEYFAEEKMTGIKRSWEEIVSPRKGKYYNRPLAVLVNHWTGSIAEGITIGFDALHRSRTFIIGTPMARLNGAVYTYEMPNSKIGFSFVAERLYHINGLPREKYLPPISPDLMNRKTEPGKDIFISTALAYLERK